MKLFPSWRYHKELGAKIIHSSDEEQDGWIHSPAQFDEQVKEEIKQEIKAEEPKEEKKKSKKAKE